MAAAGNTSPTGIWSDGTTMWVGDHADDKIYAYTLATGQRDSGKDFDDLEAGNAQPRDRDPSVGGLWFDATIMWMADWVNETIYAYARTTRQRDPDLDIISLAAAGNTAPRGIWSNDTTVWAADELDYKIYAYGLDGGQRDAGKDINSLAAAGNASAWGLWSDGTTMWVGDLNHEKIYAYELANGKRDAVRDFDDLAAAGNNAPRGLWSNGTTMWVADWLKDKLYAYNMPGNPDLSALSLSAGTSTPTWSPSFHRLTTAYAVSVANSASTITVTATAVDAGNATVEFLDADDMPLADADGVTDGQQVNLVVGDKTIKVKVTAEDDVTTRTYTLTVTREAPAPVSFGSSSYNVGEGQSVTVTVSLDQALSGQVVVPLNVTAGSGISGDDYSGVPASVPIAPARCRRRSASAPEMTISSRLTRT